MKKLIFTFLFLIASVVTYGQTIVYSQSFENPITGITPAGTPGFVPDTLLYHDGVQSYHGTFDTASTISATTDPFDLIGQTFVVLKFWHICKLEFFDRGVVEVSPDGGATWIALTCVNSTYMGTATSFCGLNKFMESSYTTWKPGTDTIPADSSWWKEEQFDVSAILGTGLITNAMVRFVATDLNNNGMFGREGWYIDEVSVIGSPCEITMPTFTQIAPLLDGTVYSIGPYTLNGYAYDASGIYACYVIYSVNGVPQPTVPMFNPTGDSLYTCQLPGVNDGDTVCYQFYIQDGSPCLNYIFYPDPTGAVPICFIASKGEPIPYCDDFDINNLWADSSSVSGSHWELGTPNFGATSSPHSAPNAWDISLNSGYSFGTDAYLVSPVFDFGSLVNGQMSFWYNCATNTFNQDGVRLETSVLSGPWTLLTTASDPSAVNWYNSANISSSNQPAWSGNSGGWKQAKFNLSSFNNAGGVQMRFVFTSDNTGDGFSIDDFCIIQPPPQDMGVDNIIEPFSSAAAGDSSNAIVRVRNFGTAIQTTFDVWYSVNGVVPAGGPLAYTGAPIAPNDTAIITLPKFVVQPLNYDFCAWTSLAADSNTTNDTLCVIRQGVPKDSLSYCTTFDITGADWTSIPSPVNNTVWELGTPAYGATNSAFSNPNSWDVNLTTAYESNANAILVSPYFDFGPAANVDLSFWQNRNCEAGWDGTHMEYSVNSSPWAALGTIGSANSINWYTDNINSCNCDAWDGNSNGWVKSSLNVSQFNNIGLVQLRYVFTSDASFNDDGFSIDNFCLHVPQPIDVGVDSVIRPTVNGGAGQVDSVRVRVRNFGSTPISAFDIVYVLDSGVNIFTSPPIPYSGPTLAPNASALVTIPPSIIIPNGLFTVCAYTSLATDMDHTNDTTCKNCKGIPVLPLNYCENFDGVNNDWTPVLISGSSQWELGAPNFGTTNSAHSAPNAWDVNLTTGYTAGSNCELLSPFFDFTNAVNAKLSFWQNRNTQAFQDGTRLDIFDGNVWSTLGTINDPLATNWYTVNNIFISNKPAWDGNSNGWINSTYQLINYNNIGAIQLKYVFRSANFSTGDGMSIDDFCITIPPPQDAGAVSIDAPTGGLIIGNIYFPTVTIKNYGSADIDSIPVTYTVNGTPVATQLYTGTLVPNAPGQVFFNTPFTALAGGFDVCAYTGLSGDGDLTNDTTCTQLVGIPTLLLTYADNFDGANNGWTTNILGDPGSNWELGTPSVGATSSSHSAPNCWDVNLATPYTNQANCELISPFFDFTSVVNAEVSFWINVNTETNWDGLRLDYSADGGASFTTLGDLVGASCLNWYNSNLFTNNKPAWNGNTGGWLFCKDSDLVFLNNSLNTVVFKFVFEADGGGVFDGVSVDDFLLYNPITVTAATDLVYPYNNIFTPGPQRIMGRYVNTGTTPMTKVLLSLKIDGTLIVTDTIDPVPGPGGQLNLGVKAVHQFTKLWNASPGPHDFCIYTSQPNFTSDLDNSDDTTCTVITVFDSTSFFPYCNDFESGPQWVALNSVDYSPTSSWQIGTPIKTNIIGSHSGANCWVTNLVSEYPSADNSSLFSPVFNVQGGKCYELSFYQNVDMDIFNDGGMVEYTLDSAKTWIQLGDGGDQLNWYNSNYIAAFGGPPQHAGWTATFGGWYPASHNWKCNQSGQVIFRWRFASDLTNNSDGWAVDDVCFKEITGTCITTVGEVDASGFYLYQNAPNPANGKTSIAFSLPKSGKAVMTVTNLVGQVVAQPVNANFGEGRHTVDLNSKDFAPGIYYYTLKFEGRKIVRKMVITE